MALCSFVNGSSLRRRKWPLSRYKGKWHQTFSEQQAMEELKRTVVEQQACETDFLSIILNSFQKYGTAPGPSAYSFVIEHLCQGSLLSHLPPILDHLEKVEEFETTERIFINLIRTYASANMLQEAVNTFFRIPKFRCKPSVYAFNSLLSVLCMKTESLVLVHDVLMRTPEMNIRLEASSFWILIRALCKHGKVGYAIVFLKIMQQHECIAEPRLYSSILSTLCKHSCSRKIMLFIEEMENAGFSPTRMDYSYVIDVLIKEGKMNDAYAVLKKMKSDGKGPDIVIYNNLMLGFISNEDFQMGEEMFDEVLLNGLVPDASTFNIYIGGLCKLGDFGHASKILVSMEKLGCKPDVITYNTLMSAYSKAGEVDNVREIMTKMHEKGVKGDVQTCRILIDGMLSKGEIVETLALLNEFLCRNFAPHHSAFDDLICRLCESGLICEAIEVLMKMTNQSVVPGYRVWEALLVTHKLTCVSSSANLEEIIKPLLP